MRVINDNPAKDILQIMSDCTEHSVKDDRGQDCPVLNKELFIGKIMILITERDKRLLDHGMKLGRQLKEHISNAKS